MAITVSNYSLFLQSLIEGRVNLQSDEVWCMLVTSSYVFNQHTHKFKSVVTGELAGSGYTPGGQKVTLAAQVYNSVTKMLSLPAGNSAWPAVTWVGATGAILYVKKSDFAENAWPLISFIDFGQSVNRTAQAFYLNWPTTGILKMVTP